MTTCNPYFFDGQNLTQTGSYLYQGTTIWGCDSTIQLNLDYGSPIIQNFSDEACGSYAWNNQNYFSSGIYVDTFPSVNGCDSIVTLDLTIHPIDAISLDSTVFDSFNWNGTVYSTSGTYTQFFTSSFGCDSTVTINLTVQHNGLEENNLSLTLYPNPIAESKLISIEGISSPVHFEIRNLQGKIVQEGSFVQSIKLAENITSGVYFITMQDRKFKILVE